MIVIVIIIIIVCKISHFTSETFVIFFQTELKFYSILYFAAKRFKYYIATPSIAKGKKRCNVSDLVQVQHGKVILTLTQIRTENEKTSK